MSLAGDTNSRFPTGLWRAVVLPMAIVTGATIGVATYVFTSAQRAVTAAVADDMAAIGRLKAAQIAQWLRSRRVDAELIATSHLATDLERWNRGGRRDDGLSRSVLEQLKGYAAAAHYPDISLHDTDDGRQLFSTAGHLDLPALRSAALGAAKRGDAVLEDIHVAEFKSGGATDIGLFVPVRGRNDGRVLAVLHITIDPGIALFPMLKLWPGASASAETLLLRRDGSDVVYLSPLRHTGDAVPSKRVPVGTPQFVSGRLVSGAAGFIEGVDYRGVPSLAFGQPIADTPWYLIAKIDRAEAFAEFNAVAAFSIALLCLLELVFGWWLLARRRLETDLRQAYLEVDDLYQNAPCGYHSLDGEGRFVRINDTELKLLGYERDEIIGRKKIQELLSPASLADFARNFPRLKELGQLQDMEVELIRKDGTLVSVLVNASAVRDEQGRFMKSRSSVFDLTELKQTQAALRESETNYRSVVAAMAEGVVIQDAGGRVIAVNAAAERIEGRRARDLEGHTAEDPMENAIHEDGSPFPGAEHPSVLTLRTGKAQTNVVMGIRRPDGELRWLSVNSQPVRSGDDSRPDAVVTTFHDITERKLAEDAQRRLLQEKNVILESALVGIAFEKNRTIATCNRRFEEIFGYAPGALIGHSTRVLYASDEIFESLGRRAYAVGDRDEPFSEEVRLRRGDGQEFWGALTGRVLDAAHPHDGSIWIYADISERKHHEAALKEIAHHDPLTKLPNRLLLADRLHQAIGQSRRLGSRVAICYLDLDGFKAINDSLGHAVGDRLLVEVSDRLLATVRGGDTVARLGGDEFVLLLAGLGDDEECRNALERLLAVVSAPYALAGKQDLAISASIGVTVFPDDTDDADTLIRHADHAMYAAKQAGKNRYQFFDMPLERAIEARHAARQRIETALSAGQFLLHYQPKVDCRAGRVVGAEALIRWQHPTLGLLSPSEFLPVIEDDPLAIAVGDWVIGETLRQIAEWRHQGLELRISANAFARQLLQPGFAEGLRRQLAAQPGVGPGQLQIEIVETTAVDKLDAVRAVIEACAAFGVDFALDDFGTGYSSLVYLRHLPARELKIDQSFVRDMLVDDSDLTIVEAVIGLGRAFHLSVIAEGVETQAHVRRLVELGCDIMQGYALARPMPASELPRWVREYRSPADLREVGGHE